MRGGLGRGVSAEGNGMEGAWDGGPASLGVVAGVGVTLLSFSWALASRRRCSRFAISSWRYCWVLDVEVMEMVWRMHACRDTRWCLGDISTDSRWALH